MYVDAMASNTKPESLVTNFLVPASYCIYKYGKVWVFPFLVIAQRVSSIINVY